jgi:hypothetical protein
MLDRMKRDTIWRRMIDIDSDILPRRVKGRTEDVIEGLRGTSAVRKQLNTESSLDRGVSGTSHFPGVRGTKLLYIRRKLFLSSSLALTAGMLQGTREGKNSGFEFCGVAPLWRPFLTVFLGLTSCFSSFDIFSAVLGSISRFHEWRSVPDKDMRVPAGRASRRLTFAGNAPESVRLPYRAYTARSEGPIGRELEMDGRVPRKVMAFSVVLLILLSGSCCSLLRCDTLLSSLQNCILKRVVV